MLRFHLLIFSTLFLFSCNPKTPDLTEANTFDLIQDQILTPNCATSGCHLSSSDPAFKQHGLILNKGQAFANLFNVDPTNITAKEEGLMRVIPGDFENSLLYQKLLFVSTHESEKNFGSIMPLGGDLLFQGQIDFIKEWILAGAPEKGSVADYNLLNDKTPSLAIFEPLAPPSIAEGFQMKIEPFEIFPYFEREIFLRKTLNNPDTAFIDKFQIKMHPGSHHFILYGFRDPDKLPEKNIIRDLRKRDESLDLKTFQEIGNHVFYFGGSESNFTFNFPEGTAVVLPPNMEFDMNSHYFNRGAKSYNGEVNINLYTVDKSKVKNRLKILDLGNNNLIIPAKQRTTISKTFTFNKDIKIVTLFSHTHKLGEKFEILIKGGIRDGEVIYTSLNWEHPEKIDFEIPVALKQGEGLTSRITYNNYTDQTVRFGLTSTDEMGIIFGYYYED